MGMFFWELLELGSSIALSVWNADGGGANIEVTMLMVASVWGLDVESEFDVN